ncbi:MAG: hypothetical protein R3C04_10340 [Hyphomonas sp.]
MTATDIAADYKADFVVFPELFTLQLLSLEHKPLGPVEAIEKISRPYAAFIAFDEKLAVSYNINIIAGTHPSRMEPTAFLSISYVFLRDGSVTSRSCANAVGRCGGTSRRPGRGQSRPVRPDRRDDLLRFEFRNLPATWWTRAR